MTERLTESEMIPRSKLATIAHRMVSKASSEKQAAQMIVSEIKNRGHSADLEVANVNGIDHWVAIIPASGTNYDPRAEEVAVVPDMSVEDQFSSNHVGVVTPDKEHI